MNCTVFGLDLAKRVFQLHWVDMETGEICLRQLKRQQVAEFFVNRNPGIIAMEPEFREIYPSHYCACHLVSS